MSNRLATTERMLKLPEVELAGGAMETYLSTRRQAETVMEYGRALADTVRAVWRAIAWIGQRVDEAEAMRDLAALNDRMLADIGLKRSDIPLLYSRARQETAPAPAEPKAAA